MSVRKMDWGYLVLRLAFGVIFLAHGAQKLFGAFGGGGIGGTAGFLGGLGFPFPVVWAVALAVVEFFGGLLVLVGLLTRLWAAALAINMLVAMSLVHWPNGFFVGEGGIEFVLMLFATALALVIGGAGKLSLDWNWRRQRRTF